MSDNNDSEDFLNEMSGIKPLTQDKITKNIHKNQAVNDKYRQKVAQSFKNKDCNFLTEVEVEAVEPDEILSYKLDGIQPAVFKNLRQGKYGYDYQLDLHRKTVAEARVEVYELLKYANKYQYRTLLLTHGKGATSNPPARLKSYVNHWLKQVNIVVAFHSATPRHGGTGSVYVLLKKPEKKNQINQAKYT